MGATDCASEFSAPVIIGVDVFTMLWCMNGNAGNALRPAAAATAAAAELDIDCPFEVAADDFGSARGVKSSAPARERATRERPRKKTTEKHNNDKSNLVNERRHRKWHTPNCNKFSNII